MAEGTRLRKYSVYNSLQLVLYRAKVKKSGAVATLLLECFLEDGGRLPASKVVARGVCEEGCFHTWRDEMVKGGWIVWSLNQGDKGQYHPGKKLLSYINKEKIATKEIVTRSDFIEGMSTKADKSELEETKKQLKDTQRKMQEIAEAVRELQEAMIPPDTPQKESVRKHSAQKIASLSTIQ